MKNRIWELDFVRGVAILFVVLFHTLYDMQFMYGYSFPFGWQWLSNLAGIFILIAGICAPFSRSCTKKGVVLLVFAMIITVVTYIYDKENFIRFGILHQLSFCMLIYPLLKKFDNIALAVISVVIMTAGIFLNNDVCPYPHLYALGWADSMFSTMDWFPIMPYTAFFTLGILISRCVYSEKMSLFTFNQPFFTKSFCFVGRYTLWIYLLQQPVTLALLEVLAKK